MNKKTIIKASVCIFILIPIVLFIMGFAKNRAVINYMEDGPDVYYVGERIPARGGNDILSYIVIDVETGINYIVFINNNGGITVTPRILTNEYYYKSEIPYGNQ